MSKFVRGLVLAGAMTGLVAVGSEFTAAQEKKAAAEKIGTLEIGKDKEGKYRFKAMGSDGKTIMQSSKGYATKEDALKAIEAAKAALTKGKVIEKDD